MKKECRRRRLHLEADHAKEAAVFDLDYFAACFDCSGDAADRNDSKKSTGDSENVCKYGHSLHADAK